MPYLQIGDQQFPLRPGDQRVGTDEGADIRVPGPDDPTARAVVALGADGQVIVRRGVPDAAIRINGVLLDRVPSPLTHGDRLTMAGVELRFGDAKQGGSTQFVSSAQIAEIVRAKAGPAKPTTATGGRLVSLVDGREYAVPSTGLVIGREAGCDVVVPSTEVSRRHAQIAPDEGGYVVTDLSTNGVFVNGARVVQSQVLGRGDVVKIGTEEFRFYADVAKPAAPPAGAAPPAPAAVPAPSSSPPRAQPGPPPSAPLPSPPAGVAGQVLATLEIVNEGPLKGTRFELRLPLTHVGRGPHNDVVLESESVSGSHAKLQRREAGWFVVDMGSTNGTYVAGRRIDGEAPLGAQAEVRFGDLKLAFRVTDEAAPGADEGKGTRAIAAAQVQQARALRPSTAGRPGGAAPPPQAPAAAGGAGKVVVAVVVVAALALAGWLLTR